MRRVIVMTLSCAALIGAASGVASAGTITWTQWTTHFVSPTVGTAAGTMGSVGVSYNGDVSNATQTAPTATTNYWLPDSPYLSATVGNAPLCCDIVALQSGPSELTFSSPVVNPIMAIVSLGRLPPLTVDYTFEQPFDVLSSGKGYWGAPGSVLEERPGNVLHGEEGHGAIQFLGTFSKITWTTAPSEYWHGFQIGVTQEASVPDPASTLLLLSMAGSGLIALTRHWKKQ